MKQCYKCKLGYDGHGGRRCSLDGNGVAFKEKCIDKKKILELQEEIEHIKKIRGKG
jgi:hypothetical protein